MTTAPSHELTLRDRLSRLTLRHANVLLGEDARALLRRGGLWDIPLDRVALDDHRMQVSTTPRQLGRSSRTSSSSRPNSQADSAAAGPPTASPKRLDSRPFALFAGEHGWPHGDVCPSSGNA